MTLVSNDPSWWPVLYSTRSYSYFVVASFAAVVYDLTLTLGQEIELIWMQRWSLMAVLYFFVRYAGIPYAMVYMLVSLPTVSLTDAVSNTMFSALNWMNVIVTAMLDVIVIVRLHAMYHRSRKMLIFLVVIFLAVTVACVVTTAIGFKYIVGVERILSDTYVCYYDYEGDVQLLIAVVWTLTTVWEIFALCLSVWVSVKHFRDLRRFGPSSGSTIGDCFTVLIKSHVLYFASIAAVSCFNLSGISATFADPNSLGTQIYYGILQIVSSLQLFVLGPRLVLSVRQYYAELVANSDAGIGMTSIAFQERVSTSSTV